MRFAVSLLLIACMLIAVTACAPKKVRVYEGVPPTKGDAIAEYGLSLLGRPYKSAAKGPDAFDCSGFVYYVYRRFDISLPYTTDELARSGYPVGKDVVMAGDLVIFNVKRGQHIGIMMNPREFVHASSSKGVAIGNIDSLYWRRGLSQFRRVL